MSTNFIFPKPRDWNTFEDIVADVFSRKYRNYNLQRYGRSGQRQSGIDIAGSIETGVIGVQCKHHPSGNISISEIDREVTLSESFKPALDEYIIATSADRDTSAHQYIIDLSKKRRNQGKYPVYIKFWDDIYSWLVEYPDLLYKHFTIFFPSSELENLSMPGLFERRLKTVTWPATSEDIRSSVIESTGSLGLVDPYKISLSVTNFPDVTYTGIVDIEIQLADLFSNNTEPQHNFIEAAKILKEIKQTISSSDFDKELFVVLQARLSLSFLLGWIFRKVTQYNLTIGFGNNIWATDRLPPTLPNLIDGLPIVMNQDSREVVLVLNISRDITKSVRNFVDGWDIKPFSINSIGVEGNRIISAAQALSVAVEISRKTKNLIDIWGANKIHLFSSMPSALATLISYHLNAICPIHLYFLDESRTEYKLAGVLHNSL